MRNDCNLLLFSMLMFSPALCTAPCLFIYIYGIPCSGKTTLSKFLQGSEPHKYIHIERDVIRRELREVFIKDITGRRPSDRQEYHSTLAALKTTHRVQLSTLWIQAGQLCLAQGVTAQQSGKHILFDGGTDVRPSQHQLIRDVLIYAPPSLVFARERTRSSSQGLPPIQRARLLSIMLNRFVRLYRPCAKSDPRRIAEWDKKMVYSLLNQLNPTEAKEAKKKLTKAKNAFIKQFFSSSDEVIAIRPRHAHDLVLDSTKASPRSLARLLVQLIEQTPASPRQPKKPVHALRRPTHRRTKLRK